VAILLLLGIPAAFVLIGGLLALSWALECSVLSPKSMILTAARSVRSDPDYAEQFVAREFERLLQNTPGR
jgi:hypothetical protein